MKRASYFLASGLAGLLLLAAFNRPATKGAYGLTMGTPELKSISALSFGPAGILFIGDSKGAAIYAVDTKDAAALSKAEAIDIKNIDVKIAESLGTTKENITITDMAVNPISKKLYFAVQSGDGTPALLKLDGSKLVAVSLKDVNYSSVLLTNVAAEDAKDQRGRSLRINTISDMGYSDGQLMVSGLSNKEFSSSFRSIAFPFSGKLDEASLEMYHAAHGRYETTSPIRSFTTGVVNGKKYLIAGYTCTPLVLFPLDEMKAGANVKGRTVAEMGNGNTPVDMIKLNKGSESFLVLANDRRPVAKVNYKSIETFQGSLTTPVGGGGTAGVEFVKLPLEKVMQLDKLDENRAVFLQRLANGDVNLWTSDGKSL